MKNLIFVSIVILIVNMAVLGQSAIQKVDFKNFTYLPSCTDMEGSNKRERITVKDGEFERSKEADGYTDHFFFSIMSVAYGDLTGDNQDEAVVLSVCNTGGTGQFTEGFVYTLKAGKPSLLTRIEGGDRADGGLVSASIENGLLSIEANESSSNSGACCPEFTVTEKFRLTAGKLVGVGKGIRRELYPAERIAFDRGASSKTMTTTIAAYEKKRFSFGAGAGQTLKITTDADDVSFSLREDVESTDAPRSYTAKLPKKGNYTIEVANGADKEREITFTVSIK